MIAPNDIQYIASITNQEGIAGYKKQSIIIVSDFDIVGAMITIWSNIQICLSQKCFWSYGQILIIMILSIE